VYRIYGPPNLGMWNFVCRYSMDTPTNSE